MAFHPFHNIGSQMLKAGLSTNMKGVYDCSRPPGGDQPSFFTFIYAHAQQQTTFNSSDTQTQVKFVHTVGLKDLIIFKSSDNNL